MATIQIRSILNGDTMTTPAELERLRYLGRAVQATAGHVERMKAELAKICPDGGRGYDFALDACVDAAALHAGALEARWQATRGAVLGACE